MVVAGGGPVGGGLPGVPPQVPGTPIVTYEEYPHLVFVLQVASDAQLQNLAGEVAAFLGRRYVSSILEPVMTTRRFRSTFGGFFNFFSLARARWQHVRMQMGPSAKSWRPRGGSATPRYSLLPVFPGADRLVTTDPDRASTFFLHRFWQLTLPMRAEHAQRALGDRFNGVAYDFAYRLRDELGLAHVEADPTIPGLTPLQIPDATTEPDPETPMQNRFGGCFEDDRDPARREWHLHRTGVIDPAGTRIPVGGATGVGVRIGHPDTGYTLHPELNFSSAGVSQNVDEALAVNVLDETLEPGAIEPPDRPGGFAYHGTGTASALISQPPGGDDQVHGIAPGATLVPVRTNNSVVLVGGSRLARAIYYLTDAAQVDVISVSLGGLGRRTLQAAIGYANSKDVIIVCAAGNTYVQGQPARGVGIGSVIAPAINPETIAVAGSTFGDEPWRGSARGGAVDVAAPARCVWRATWEGSPLAAVRGPSSGTSYSAPMVAGAAALWLETHGKQNLVNYLGGVAPLSQLFRAHLRRTARRPTGWPSTGWGAGILNVAALCDPATLPAADEIESESWLDWAIEGWCDTLARMLDPIPPEIAERWITEQGLDCDDVDAMGEELAAFLAASAERWRAFVGWVAEVALTVGESVLDAVRLLVCETVDIVEAAVEAGAQLAQDIAQAIEDAADNAVQTGREVVRRARRWLSDRFRSLWR